MWRYLKTHLFVRIGLLFVVTMTSFGVLMGLYIRSNNEKRRQAQRLHEQTRGRDLERSLSSNLNIIYAVLSWDKDAIDKELASTFSGNLPDYLVIYNEYARPIYEKFRPGLSTAEFDFAPPTVQSESEIESSEIKTRSGEPFLNFVMPITITHKSLVPTGASSTRAGYVRVGLDLGHIEAEVRKSTWEGIGLVALVAVCGGLIIGLSFYWIIPPLNGLIRASQAVGKGDLSQRVKVDSEHELGLMAATFNQTIAGLEEHNRVREDLLKRIEKAVALVTDASAEMLAVSAQQETNAQGQAAIVDDLVGVMEQTSATAGHIAERAGSVSVEAAQTSETCAEGKKFMDETVAEIARLSSESEALISRLAKIRKQAGLIGGIIKIIEEISSQINLLALNAEIEAASAGERGRRFGAVAVQVKSLAGRSLDSADSVRQMIGGFLDSFGEVAAQLEREQEIVSRSEASVRNLGQYFQTILDLAETARQSSSTIGIITQQQAAATRHMVSSIKEVETAAEEVKTGARRLTSFMNDLKKMADSLDEVVSGHGGVPLQ